MSATHVVHEIPLSDSHLILIKNISIHNRFDAFDAVTSCVAPEFDIYLESSSFQERKELQAK